MIICFDCGEQKIHFIYKLDARKSNEIMSDDKLILHHQNKLNILSLQITYLEGKLAELTIQGEAAAVRTFETMSKDDDGCSCVNRGNEECTGECLYENEEYNRLREAEWRIGVEIQSHREELEIAKKSLEKHRKWIARL